MRSSAVSLAAASVALGVVALVLFAAPLWYAWQVTIQESRTEILQADAQRLAEVYRRDGEAGLAATIGARVRMQIVGERILLLTDGRLRPLAGNLASWPATVPTAPGNYRVTLQSGAAGTQSALAHVERLGDDYLLVARDNRLFGPLVHRFWYGLAAAFAALLICGTLVGLITRRRLMWRVHGIRQTISAIMQGDLKQRLPTGRREDELAILAHTINGMLDQIEVLVNGVRNVSNSIAHDLRTPLAELRSRLEQLALIRPSPAETFTEVDGAVADIDRVIRIFDALLRLAEIDAGVRRAGFVRVDVSDLAATAAEFYAPAAELRDVRLECRVGGPLPVVGDPVLLSQALANLIDNAIKYAPAGGGVVEVVAERRGDGVEITVSDNGPGIAGGEKARVLERFYRGDASRGTPGAGLGLSLVQAIAKLHGCGFELRDRRPGLEAALRFPPAAATARAERPDAAASAARAILAPHDGR